MGMFKWNLGEWRSSPNESSWLSLHTFTCNNNIVLFCSVEAVILYFGSKHIFHPKVLSCGFLPHCLAFTVYFLQKVHFFSNSKPPQQNITLHLFESRFISDGSFWKVGLELLFKTELKLFQGEKRWQNFILNRKIFLIKYVKEEMGLVCFSFHYI